MNYLVHATPVHPSLCLQYLILLFTIDTVTIFTLLLLLLFYYCHYYKTVATDKPLQASLFPGATELTTLQLRLINILWLPLCQINKFGFYFPWRLLRSPILVGHQDYFLAPLPGSIALFVRSLGIHIVRCNLIHPKHIYNFWCSMLVYTPFALCFVTLRGVFMRFPELTYWRDATVLVPCFLLFLCFRKATQEIFSELDKTKAEPPIFPGRKTKTKREPEGVQGSATP
jgi:hypothetical protein